MSENLLIIGSGMATARLHEELVSRHYPGTINPYPQIGPVWVHPPTGHFLTSCILSQSPSRNTSVACRAKIDHFPSLYSPDGAVLVPVVAYSGARVLYCAQRYF